jgi:exodeoxyribonuclease VII large subunit
MQDAGLGKLLLEFETLKQELKTLGWFDDSRKRPVSEIPKTIGLITSPIGAAIHDMLVTLGTRFPVENIILYPTAVQGVEAAPEIAKAIRTANTRQECEVLIVARGGGSLEDLWGFNTRKVAEEIVNCTIPIITGIGHESDVTIADFVADVRAPTPTGAAQLAVMDTRHFREQLLSFRARLFHSITQNISDANNQVRLLETRLVHPIRQLDTLRQNCDDLEKRLNQSMHQQLQQQRFRLKTLSLRLETHSPEQHIRQQQQRLSHLSQTLHHTIQQHLNNQQHILSQLQRHLSALSPTDVLARGYAIAFDATGVAIKDAVDLSPDEVITVRVHQGKIGAKVIEVED